MIRLRDVLALRLLKSSLLALRVLYKQVEDTANFFGDELDKLTRQAYRGKVGVARFSSDMRALLAKYLREAYVEGFIESGLDEEDLDKADERAIANELDNQSDYVKGFAQAVFDAKDESALKPAIDARVTYWTRSIAAMGQLAKANAKPRKLWVWKLGHAEVHCVGKNSCPSLNGQVHTMRWWVSHNLLPRKPASDIACHGFNCQCELLEV